MRPVGGAELNGGGRSVLLAERLSAQLLSGTPASSPVAVAERLLAIQGQDPRGARLAVRARSARLTASDVDRALTEERSLLITWLNRGTLHLVRSEDYPWLHALTTPPLLRGNARRLSQEGVPPADAERAVAAIERAVSEEGPLTRAALRERVAARGVRTEGQALIHILFLASLRGLIVRGPMIGAQHAYVLVRDWLQLGEPRRVDRGQALAELARRYLAGHGPADDRDLAKWAGLPLRDVRAGLKLIAGELDEREDGLVALASAGGRAGGPAGAARRAGRSRLPPPRLLGPFDPLLHGWASCEPVDGPARGRLVSGGIFRPFALVRGRATAVWSLRDGSVAMEPFAEISAADTRALAREADDVMRFLGGDDHNVR